MDVVAGLLDGPRARGAFLLRSHLRAPWGMRIEDEAPLTIVPVLRGSGWVGPVVGDDGADPGEHVGTGDVVLLRGPDHYVVADAPTTAPQVVIGPESDMCRAVDGGPSPMTVLGVRSWGNDPGGETVIITGTYPLDGEVGRRVLRVLPQRVVLRSGDVDGTLVEMLAREVVQDLPGQEAVLDRLLDLLLISCLRTWLSRDDAPGWYRADADPVVGAALRLIHHDPARAWTVDSLAREVGLSRAAFSRRFTALVGEPPMSLSHGLAPRPRRRPAAGARRHADVGRTRGRVRVAVRAERRVQARARREPGRAPGTRGRRLRGLSAAPARARRPGAPRRRRRP